jgi:hypothetical protein
MIVGLEIEHGHEADFDEFIGHVACGIRENYGAGNCTPDSVAFWTMGYLPKTKPTWMRVVIEIDGDDLSEYDIAAAVSKVRDADSGDIVIFDHVVGRWSITNRP